MACKQNYLYDVHKIPDACMYFPQAQLFKSCLLKKILKDILKKHSSWYGRQN